MFLYEKFISDKLKSELAVAFGRKSHNMLPTEHNLLKMSRDSIFDLIEFLSEYVSEPLPRFESVDAAVHEYARRGLEKWRKAVNERLEQLDPPYKPDRKQGD